MKAPATEGSLPRLRLQAANNWCVCVCVQNRVRVQNKGVSSVTMIPHICTCALPLLLASLYAQLLFVHAAHSRLSLPPLWSFSTDLSFPSPPSSSSLNSYSAIAPFSLFISIISSTSFDAGSKGFSFGLLSLFESSASNPTQIYLAICLGVGKNGASSSPFLVPVWNLNYSRPLKQLGQGLVRLEVNGDKDLLLEDGDGSVVWKVSNVEGMEMQENGNLVIYDSRNQTVWQSFDHPNDILLQGQRLREGMVLTSSNHMYKAVMQPGGILSYLDSANPLPLAYWVYTANDTVGNYLDGLVTAFDLNKNAPINITSALASSRCNSTQAYTLLDTEYLVVHGACGELTANFFNTSDLVKLDSDGNLRDYYIRQSDNSGYTITSHREEFQPCYTPNVCGAYGICSMSTFYGDSTHHTCRCPSEEDNQNLSNAFNFIDASNPSQGCQRKVSLQCGQNSTQSLVEIKNVAFMSMLYFYENTWRENTIALEDCKAACSLNCSCSGFFYHIKSSFCLPFGDSTAMSNLSFLSLSSVEHVGYVKIQSVSEESSPSHVTAIVVAVVLVGVSLAVFAAAAAVLHRKWKQKRDPEARLAEEELLGVLPMLPTRFSYQELSRFTKGFSKRLGSGGFGSVYEGELPDGRRVAVKKLELFSHGQKEFLAEIATIGGISHVNIVSLYGFCLEKKHRLLVYEYMENGSLDKWLFSKEGDQHLQVMSWETRFNVALSTARGLAYLHEECSKPILHFDVKPQNILLDEEFNSKLADFGLSKLVVRGQSSVMTTVRGTPGYIAPEWVSHSIVSRKCDVYSFGMVLLELVSGRKNVEMELMGTEEWYFPKWAAKKSGEDKVADLVDKRLVKRIEGGAKNDGEHGIDWNIEENTLEQMKRAVGVALLCIHEEPEMRPNMTHVCSMLEGTVALPKDALRPLDTEVPSFKVTSSGTVVISHYSSVEGR